MMANAKFWDRIAPKYARDKIKNMTAYEATLTRVRARLSPTDHVLEMGCGTGSTALLLADAVADYTGSDISEGMIKIAQTKLNDAPLNNLRFTVAPSVETRFDAGAYDAVLAFNLLHLVPDLARTLTRAQGLLKPGGQLITKTPCLGQMTWFLRPMIKVMQLFGRAPYVRIFKAPELEAEIRKAGFEIEEARAFEGSPNTWFVVARKI